MKAIVCMARTVCFASMVFFGSCTLFFFVDLHFQAAYREPGFGQTANLLPPHVSSVGIFSSVAVAVISGVGAFKEYKQDGE